MRIKLKNVSYDSDISESDTEQKDATDRTAFDDMDPKEEILKRSGRSCVQTHLDQSSSRSCINSTELVFEDSSYSSVGYSQQLGASPRIAPDILPPNTHITQVYDTTYRNNTLMCMDKSSISNLSEFSGSPENSAPVSTGQSHHEQGMLLFMHSSDKGENEYGSFDNYSSPIPTPRAIDVQYQDRNTFTKSPEEENQVEQNSDVGLASGWDFYYKYLNPVDYPNADDISSIFSRDKVQLHKEDSIDQFTIQLLDVLSVSSDDFVVTTHEPTCPRDIQLEKFDLQSHELTEINHCNHTHKNCTTVPMDRSNVSSLSIVSDYKTNYSLVSTQVSDFESPPVAGLSHRSVENVANKYIKQLGIQNVPDCSGYQEILSSLTAEQLQVERPISPVPDTSETLEETLASLDIDQSSTPNNRKPTVYGGNSFLESSEQLHTRHLMLSAAGSPNGTEVSFIDMDQTRISSIAGPSGYQNNLAHNAERTFKCDTCEKGFSRKDHLQRHKRIHTGERPYICDICGKRFARTDNLYLHLKVHAGEKPYNCNICGKSYSKKSYVELHKQLGACEKQYICNICGENFSRRRTLIQHKRTHIDKRE